jgi:hypothetical protein
MCSQVVFEKSAVLVLLKKAVLPCAVHRALHLFRERFWRFCHLISLKTSHSASLLLAFALQFLRLSLGRSASREGRCGGANEDANFCKAKGKERRAQNSLALY